MNSEELSSCRDWFEDYVASFRGQDKTLDRNMALKLHHTFRVTENIRRIADTIFMDEEDRALAEAIAIFHDVGRFEQLRRYGSFNDRTSADHSQIGLLVLNRSGVLRPLPKRERRLIRMSIWHHNKYRLPDSKEADLLLYSRLIRDADKLDIFRVILEHFEKRKSNPNHALDFGMAEMPGLSPEVVADVLRERNVRIPEMRTLQDMRLMYSSWIFDINFPVTIASIQERGYIERLLLGVGDDGGGDLAKDSIRKHLMKRAMMYI